MERHGKLMHFVYHLPAEEDASTVPIEPLRREPETTQKIANGARLQINLVTAACADHPNVFRTVRRVHTGDRVP